MSVQLLVVQGKEKGKSLNFPLGDFVFGRGPECHVRPNSESVSRQHCLLLVRPQQALIRDLGSTNGTLVNGKRVLGEQPLSDGDRLQVGPLVLMVRLDRHGAIVDAHLCKQALKDDSNEYSPFSTTVEGKLTGDTPV